MTKTSGLFILYAFSILTMAGVGDSVLHVPQHQPPYTTNE